MCSLAGLDAESVAVRPLLSHEQQDAALQVYILERVLQSVRRARSSAELEGLPDVFAPCFVACLLPSELPVAFVRKMLHALCVPSLHWLTEHMCLPERLLLQTAHGRQERDRPPPVPVSAPLKVTHSDTDTDTENHAQHTETSPDACTLDHHQQQQGSEPLNSNGAAKGDSNSSLSLPSHAIMSAVEQFLAATSGAQKSFRTFAAKEEAAPEGILSQQQQQQGESPINPAAGLEALKRRGSAACIHTTSSEVVAYVLAKERRANAAAAATGSSLLGPQRAQQPLEEG